MSESLRRARRLPAEDWRLTAEALAELARASLMLRLVGWRRAGHHLVTGAGREDPELGSRVLRAVSRGARWAPWHPTCLRRACAAQRMLARRSIYGRIEFELPTQLTSTGHATVSLHQPRSSP